MPTVDLASPVSWISSALVRGVPSRMSCNRSPAPDGPATLARAVVLVTVVVKHRALLAARQTDDLTRIIDFCLTRRQKWVYLPTMTRGNGASPLLVMADIVKRFPGVVALRGVDLEVLPGEVHCLLGQNGAGKSTLIKVLAGVHTPDEGRIAFNGNDIQLSHPQAAMDLGIATIYQELDLVEGLTVAENIYLGHEKTRFGFSRRAEAVPRHCGAARPARPPRDLALRRGRQPVGGRSADREHGQGAVPRRPPHRHGRAVRGARQR